MLEEAARLQKIAKLGIKLQREATAKSADADTIFQGLIADVKALNLEFKEGAPRIVKVKSFGDGVYDVTFSNGKHFATATKYLFNRRAFQQLVVDNLGFVPIEVKDWTGFLAKFINAGK